MKREPFAKIVEEALDSLPQEFRSRIRNVAVLIEDMPPNQPSPQSGTQSRDFEPTSLATIVGSQALAANTRIQTIG